MKTYTALFALDVPHYGTEDIEADTAEQAIEIAKHLDPVDLVNDPDWSHSVCARIVSITDDAEDHNVAEDIALDDTFLRSGGEPARLLCEAAPQMLEALEFAAERLGSLLDADEDTPNDCKAYDLVCAAIQAAKAEI